MAAKILMVGSIMMDLILQMPRIPHPSESLLGTSYSNAGGGKGSNSAVAAAKAGGDVFPVAHGVAQRRVSHGRHNGVGVRVPMAGYIDRFHGSFLSMPSDSLTEFRFDRSIP